MKNLRPGAITLAAGMLLLAALACGGPTEPTNPPPIAPPEPTPTSPPAAPTPTSPPAVPYSCECDPRAEQIDINTTVPLEMQRATGGYPANCQYWCACVPGGGSSLEFGISDFVVDLDLYVAWNDYEGITGQTLVYGETYTWLSNDYGTGNEAVNISNPNEGPYYIEVCSYEGEPSPYNLTSELR